MPTRYGDMVYIKLGHYKGKIGVLIGDCPGFEKYKVKLNPDKFICIKVWDLELL